MRSGVRGFPGLCLFLFMAAQGSLCVCGRLLLLPRMYRVRCSRVADRWGDLFLQIPIPKGAKRRESW